MSKVGIERLEADASHAELIQVLERDGVVIVEDALAGEQIDGLNADLDDLIAVTAPGAPNHADFMQPFYGFETIRIDGLPGKSATYVDVLQHERLLAVADHDLQPHCVHYLLNTAQLIQIGPGETAQDLHRDDQAWMNHPRHAHPEPFTQPQLEVEVIYALSDFTTNNGGTRVVPGSHRWPLDRQPQEQEIVSAQMSRGSAVYYLGSTMHGGGANTTTDQSRRGLFTGLVVGWLRTEENFFLSTPIESVRRMPERVQSLLGYDNYLGIGVVNVGSPRTLL